MDSDKHKQLQQIATEFLGLAAEKGNYPALTTLQMLDKLGSLSNIGASVQMKRELISETKLNILLYMSKQLKEYEKGMRYKAARSEEGLGPGVSQKPSKVPKQSSVSIARIFPFTFPLFHTRQTNEV